MSRKPMALVAVVLSLGLLGAQAATAKYSYSYSVKFVCGYNPSNVGLSSDLSKKEGEPSVKFGNYATEINIVNADPNQITETATVDKSILLFVYKGEPVGREPKVVDAKKFDHIELRPMQGTMDDCNKIGEYLWGSSPNPFPLVIGYLVIASTQELDVTAVYTAQTCSFWYKSDKALECLDPDGRSQGMSVSIDVEKVPGRNLIPG